MPLHSVSATRRTVSQHGAAILGLVGLLTILAYLPLASAGYVYEDAKWRDALGLNTEWSLTLTGAWFNESARAFHLGNLLIHLVNGALLAFSVKSVWGLKAALLSTAIFLWHPVNSEAVSYIAARPDLLSTFWILLACWISLQWHRHEVLRGALLVVCAAMAMQAKPAAVVALGLIPFVLILTDRASLYFVALPLWMLLYIAIGFRARQIWQNPYSFQSEFSAWHYAGLQAVAVFTMLSRLITLGPFTVDPDWAVASRLTCWIAGVLLTVAVVSAWIGRYAVPMYASAVCWIALSLWPRFVLRSDELLHFHHLYLPMAGIAVALSVAFFTQWETPCENRCIS